MFLLYIIQSVALFLLTCFIVCYFSYEKNPIYVRVLVTISFTLSFGCFLILPMDIYETSIGDENGHTIMLIWTIVYDINAFLCWVILPIVQQYEDSGQFTRINRFKESLINNGILILAILVGGIVLIIYFVILGRFKITQIPTILATTINTFGLILVSTMLGFGLVSFPKQNFLKINYKKRLNRCFRMVQCLSSDEHLLKQQIQQIKTILQKRIRQGENNNEQQVLTLINNNFDFINFRSYGEQMEKLKKKTVASLHTIVKKRIIQKNAYDDEIKDLVKEFSRITKQFSKNGYKYWRIFFIVLFILTVAISAIIFLGEFTTFLPFMSAVNILRIVDWGSPAAYFMNCFLVTYIAYLVCHTVFSVKIYKMFSLHKRHSSASSLAFTAINMARISFPLCCNYLQITEITKAQFLTFFGYINLDSRYSFIFPIIMIVFALFNIFNIYDTIMGFFGVGMYAFDEEDAQQKAEEGQRILLEKQKEYDEENSKTEMRQLL